MVIGRRINVGEEREGRTPRNNLSSREAAPVVFVASRSMCQDQMTAISTGRRDWDSRLANNISSHSDEEKYGILKPEVRGATTGTVEWEEEASRHEGLSGETPPNVNEIRNQQLIYLCLRCERRRKRGYDGKPQTNA